MMKSNLIPVCFFFLILFFSFNASSQDMRQNKHGVGITDDRAVKVFIGLSQKYILYFSAYYTKSWSKNDELKHKSIWSLLGIRRYDQTFSKFQSFLDFDVAANWDYQLFDKYSFDSPYAADISYGIQYYLSQQLTVSGKFGVRLVYTKYSSGNTLTMHLPSTEISMNYYFRI